MARTAIPVTAITRAGVADTDPTPGDAVNGNSVANDGRTWVEVTNTGAASHTLTVHITAGVDGQPVTPRTYTIAAAGTLRVGTLPVDIYGSTLQIDVDNAELELTPYRI